MQNDGFKNVKRRYTPKSKNNHIKEKPKIPAAVLAQRELRKKHKYCYRTVNNGNVENNSTIYVVTSVAHPHQVESVFREAILLAKNMPEIFGQDFECDFQINVVRRYTGEYMGYAFVDVTNPKFYYAILGYNVDGSERAEYVDDPNWIQPKTVPKVPTDRTGNIFEIRWDESSEEERPLRPPKIKRELPPLITLGEYEYDEQQKIHLQTEATHGTFSVSPAFISPGTGVDYDSCSLYVSEVPAEDPDFLYALFARYARTSSSVEDDTHFFPRINIRKTDVKEGDAKTGIFAIVEYAHPNDTSFCITMAQKIRANYNGKDVHMPVRYAYRNKEKNNKKY
jgi:hypothetical protein